MLKRYFLAPEKKKLALDNNQTMPPSLVANKVPFPTPNSAKYTMPTLGPEAMGAMENGLNNRITLGSNKRLLDSSSLAPIVDQITGTNGALSPPSLWLLIADVAKPPRWLGMRNCLPLQPPTREYLCEAGFRANAATSYNCLHSSAGVEQFHLLSHKTQRFHMHHHILAR